MRACAYVCGIFHMLSETFVVDTRTFDVYSSYSVTRLILLANSNFSGRFADYARYASE